MKSKLVATHFIGISLLLGITGLIEAKSDKFLVDQNQVKNLEEDILFASADEPIIWQTSDQQLIQGKDYIIPVGTNIALTQNNIDLKTLQIRGNLNIKVDKDITFQLEGLIVNETGSLIINAIQGTNILQLVLGVQNEIKGKLEISAVQLSPKIVKDSFRVRILKKNPKQINKVLLKGSIELKQVYTDLGYQVSDPSKLVLSGILFENCSDCLYVSKLQKAAELNRLHFMNTSSGLVLGQFNQITLSHSKFYNSCQYITCAPIKIAESFDKLTLNDVEINDTVSFGIIFLKEAKSFVKFKDISISNSCGGILFGYNHQNISKSPLIEIIDSRINITKDKKSCEKWKSELIPIRFDFKRSSEQIDRLESALTSVKLTNLILTPLQATDKLNNNAIHLAFSNDPNGLGIQFKDVYIQYQPGETKEEVNQNNGIKIITNGLQKELDYSYFSMIFSRDDNSDITYVFLHKKVEQVYYDKDFCEGVWNTNNQLKCKFVETEDPNIYRIINYQLYQGAQDNQTLNLTLDNNKHIDIPLHKNQQDNNFLVIVHQKHISMQVDKNFTGSIFTQVVGHDQLGNVFQQDILNWENFGYPQIYVKKTKETEELQKPLDQENILESTDLDFKCGEYGFKHGQNLSLFVDLEYKCGIQISYVDAVLFEVSGKSGQKFWEEQGFKDLKDFQINITEKLIDSENDEEKGELILHWQGNTNKTHKTVKFALIYDGDVLPEQLQQYQDRVINQTQVNNKSVLVNIQKYQKLRTVDELDQLKKKKAKPEKKDEPNSKKPDYLWLIILLSFIGIATTCGLIYYFQVIRKNQKNGVRTQGSENQYTELKDQQNDM